MDPQYGQLIEPRPVPFSFGAPGWYVLAALLLLAAGVVFLLLYRRYQQNAYRRRAIRELTAMEQRYARPEDGAVLLYEANTLLKRIAITICRRDEVAGA